MAHRTNTATNEEVKDAEDKIKTLRFSEVLLSFYSLAVREINQT